MRRPARKMPAGSRGWIEPVAEAGQPIAEATLDALMAQAGIPLDAAGRTSIREGSPLLAALLARLHGPRAVEVEPAFQFLPREEG